jgi:hypothetical protein
MKARRIAERKKRRKEELGIKIRLVSRQPPAALDRYPRGFTGHVAHPGRSIETRSLPTLARCFPRNFTFYVVHPIRSIR